MLNTEVPVKQGENRMFSVAREQQQFYLHSEI